MILNESHVNVPLKLCRHDIEDRMIQYFEPKQNLWVTLFTTHGGTVVDSNRLQCLKNAIKFLMPGTKRGSVGRPKTGRVEMKYCFTPESLIALNELAQIMGNDKGATLSYLILRTYYAYKEQELAELRGEPMKNAVDAYLEDVERENPVRLTNKQIAAREKKGLTADDMREMARLETEAEQFLEEELIEPPIFEDEEETDEKWIQA